MRTKPCTILGICARVVREPAKADIAADRGQVASGRMNDVEYFPVVCELYARDHEDASVTGLPVVVADKRTLAGGALALGNACHPEANVFRLVEGSRVEDGDTVPAGLDLNGQVLLEAHRRGAVVENILKRGVFESSPVDVTRNPIIIEDRGTEFIMIHVICGAGNAGIIQSALEDELEKVIDTWKDIVHEHYGIEILVLIVSQLVEGHEGSVSDFGKIFDTVIEGAACALGCADGNPEADGASEGIINAKESLCLVGGAVLVNGYKNVVVTKDGGNAEEGGKDVRNDVEGIVKIDGKEVLVLSAREVAPVTVVRCLFLAWAGDWIKTAKAKIKEPRFGRRRVMTDEGGVSFARLLHVQRIEILCTLARVMG